MLARPQDLPPWVEARTVDPCSLPGFAEPVDAVELDIARAPDGAEVVDPVCGLRIPAAAVVVLPSGERFCSVACAGGCEPEVPTAPAVPDVLAGGGVLVVIGGWAAALDAAVADV